MKFIYISIIAGLSLSLSGCSTNKVSREHRELPSALSSGAILRAPIKIPYLDEGKVPVDVLALAIEFQKIAETGRWRDIIKLESPDKKPGLDEDSRRIDDLIGYETLYGASLLVLVEIRHYSDPASAKIRSENWMFRFEAVGGNTRGCPDNITVFRTGTEKFRIRTR